MPNPPILLAALAALLAAAPSVPAQEAADLDPGLKLNEIQVLGTHNSYAMPVDPRLLALVDPLLERVIGDFVARLPPAGRALFAEEHPNPLSPSDSLSYSHADLTTQLEDGVRSLEIDVNPDPAGDHFADPAGYRLLRGRGETDLLPFDPAALRRPGYKVLHIPDIDFRSHCPTLQQCLGDIRRWSEANPRHVPIFLILEAKIANLPVLPDPTPPVPFTRALFDALDAEIVAGLGRDRLITPDDVRGRHATLNQAIRAGGWPTLAAARGKVVVLMITATGDDATRGYLDGHPSLRGRMAFLRAQPGEDHAAFLMFDNALVRQEDIRTYARQGYIIRTRSDIEAYEAKVNDMTRAEAAFASGAQIVSTDFERPGNAFGTPYVVRLPGGGVVRPSPLLSSEPR